MRDLTCVSCGRPATSMTTHEEEWRDRGHPVMPAREPGTTRDSRALQREMEHVPVTAGALGTHNFTTLRYEHGGDMGGRRR